MSTSKKRFRNSVNFYTADIKALCQDISIFLDGNHFLFQDSSIQLGNIYLIGPLKRFCEEIESKKKNPAYKHFFNDNVKDAILQIENLDKLIARGYYLPLDYNRPELPLIVIYKLIPNYDNKPVIISENYLRPGEFVLVPENIETIAILTFYDDEKDGFSHLPEELHCVSFFGDTLIDDTPFHNEADFSVKQTFKESNQEFLSNEPIRLQKSFFEERNNLKRLMNRDEQFIQLYPILSGEKHAQVIKDIKEAPYWIGRHGDSYIQMSLDILEMTKLPDCPASIKDLIAQIQSPQTLRAISKLSGIPVESVNELYAFKMRGGERIDLHADGTRDSQLLVRMNWALQLPAPKDRPNDMRFTKPLISETNVYACPAIENSAIIFKVGQLAPHDVAPIPDDSPKDRINILLTFGKK